MPSRLRKAKQFVKMVYNHLPLRSVAYLGKAVNTALEYEKTRRGETQQQYVDVVDKIVMQPWPYFLLKDYANRHPALRVIHGAIISEVVKNRWSVKERFAKKCTVCGQEFKQPVDACPDCGAQALLRDPNPQEKKRLEAFLKDPNRDDEMIDIIKSVLKDELAVDDWYVSMIEVALGQYAIYVEDAAEMYICATERARLGNGVWFCPNCWDAQKNDRTYQASGPCPECGILLKETAYVRKDQGGKVQARFGRDEVIHGNSDPWLPRLYGNSKVAAILMELRTLLAITNYNFGLYTEGVIDKLVVLKGEGQQTANDIAAAAKEQRQAIKIDAYTGRVGREVEGSLFIGAAEGADVKDFMSSSDKMQTLEWADYYFVKVAGAIYGVQPVMMNAPVRGPGGYFQRMQLIVQNDRTKECQKNIEDGFNNGLLPKLQIYDWIFQFNEVEARNEMEDAQIWQAKVDAGTKAAQAGLRAELTDEGELKISGTFREPTLPPGASHFITPVPGPKLPEPSMPHPFAMDKMKRKGPTYLVTEVTETQSSAETEGEHNHEDK